MAMPFNPLIALTPFEKWGIYFIGPIALATKYDRKSIYFSDYG